MISKKIYLLIMIAILLSGCAEAATTQAPEDVLPTATIMEETPFVDTATPTQEITETAGPTGTPTPTAVVYEPNPLQIEVMRQQIYPGSEVVFERTLSPGSNYSQYVVSYQSEGYKIYALMTIPNGTKPETGWPVIVFNHGYIAPSQYVTTQNYVSYADPIAQSGYIVFKSDFRGHGNSDGSEVVGGGYGSPGYATDVLNAIASLQMFADADPDRIGLWGHSMGGQVTLRAMVVSEDIKAGVIWGGVVAPYPEVIARWDFTRNPAFSGMEPNQPPQNSAGIWLQMFSDWVSEFSAEYGESDQNPSFWETISPNTYVTDLSGPIQLHHSTTDEMVPLSWSEILAEELNIAGIPYEFYTYPGDNHNISGNFWTAMQRTIEFFDQYVKGQE